MKKRSEKREVRRILNAANGLTALRAVGSIPLLFLPCGSLPFTIVYTLAGLTDALDGPIARRTGTAGKTGTMLDSLSDLIFYSVLLVRFLPVFRRTLSAAAWCTVAGVIFLRLSAYAIAAVRFRRFSPMHTVLNKATGFALFLFPYSVLLSRESVYVPFVVGLAVVSSVEEFVLRLVRKTDRPDGMTVPGKE